MLDDLERRHKQLMAELARVKAAHLAGMTDAQRAALQVMGRPLDAEVRKNEDLQLEIKSRLAAYSRGRSRDGIAKNAISTAPELAKMRAHALAIERGEIIVEHDVRRRLASAILKAEMIEAEALR